MRQKIAGDSLRPLILLFLVFASGITLAAPAAPVAVWHFDETEWAGVSADVLDSSGNDYHGTAFGSATPVKGKICNAVDLSEDSVNDYIKLDEAAMDQIGDVTISVWAKTSHTGAAAILSGAVSGSLNQFLWFFPNATKFQSYLKDQALPATRISSIADDDWHHLVWRRKGKENCLFVDGVQAGSCVSGTGDILSLSNGVMILGQEQDSVGGNFDINQDWEGLLDELLIFKQALNDADIQSIYTEQNAGNNWDGSAQSCNTACPVNTAGETLFEDNFDDGDYAGWDVNLFGAGGCGWAVTNGELKERRDRCHGFLGNHLNSSNSDLQSYTIQTDIDANISGANNGVGIIFGHSDNNNYYMVRWINYGTAYAGADGSWGSTHRDFELIKVVNGSRTVLDSRPNIALPETFTLSVVVDDSGGIDVWVDCDTTVYTLHADGEHPAIKTFGLYSYDNDTGIIYDNVKVMGSTPSLPEPVGLWQFEEAVWTGTTADVLDSSNSQLHGTAKHGADPEGTDPAIPGVAGTCQYAKITPHIGPDEYIDLGAAPEINQLSDAITIAGWIKVNNRSHYNYIFSNSRDCCGTYKGVELRVANNKAVFGLWGADERLNRLASAATINLNQWYHIAATFDGVTMKIYVDGVLSGSRAQNKKIGTPASFDAAIGALGFNPAIYSLNGYLDEVAVYDKALTATQILSLKNQVHACVAPALDHFKVSHDTAGIFCAANETVLLSAIDGAGDTFTSYTGTVTLDTQNGNGNWIATTGDGILMDSVADDGLASYTFAASDQGVVAFTLSYKEGPETFNIDAYDGRIRDDDTDGDYTYSASGFLVTANPVTNPPSSDPLANQTAGQDFAVYLTAYGTTATDPVCGVIESYTGSKSLRLWGQYRNPWSGSISPQINGASISMGGSSHRQNVQFTDGKASLTANYRDAGKIRLRAYDFSGADTMSAVSNDFVVSPADFEFSTITRQADNFANPAAATASGPKFIGAGQNMAVTVTAVDVDGNPTPNFGQESTPESIGLTHALVLPAGGAAGNLSGSLSNQNDGSFTGNISWSEVGIISLTAAVADGGYLGAGNITKILPHIGRFVPDRFALSALNGGAFADACLAGSFTYIGQPFGYQTRPSLTITAQNSNGETTQNYSGAFAALAQSGVSVTAVTADGSKQGSENTLMLVSQTADLAGRILSSTANGVFLFTLGADQYSYDKDTNALVGAFNVDIDLSINTVSDGEVTTSISSGNTLSPTSTQLVYGRIKAESGHGSELSNLVLPIDIQIYDEGIGGFVTHSVDACTATPTMVLADVDGSLNSSSLTTSISGPSAGQFLYTINAPGAGQTGSASINYSVPFYLQYPWQGLTASNPSAIATFGIYSGNPVIIFRRDIY